MLGLELLVMLLVVYKSDLARSVGGIAPCRNRLKISVRAIRKKRKLTADTDRAFLREHSSRSLHDFPQRKLKQIRKLSLSVNHDKRYRTLIDHKAFRMCIF